MLRLLLCGAAALLALSGAANAQKYPSRNIEIIIPFAAGGGIGIAVPGGAGAAPAPKVEAVPEKKP